MASAHDRLDVKALERISGPAWDGVRKQFMELSGLLLAQGEEVCSALTTIYVKFTKCSGQQQPFAVIWVKNSKQMTVGFSLPEPFESKLVTKAPKGMSYKGLTGYVTVKPGEALPEALPALCQLAYKNAP